MKGCGFVSWWLLTLDDREEISRGLALDWSARLIGREIGRHHGVVAAEIARNGGRSAYRAVRAEARAVTLRVRPKERKLVANPVLHDEVNRGLAQSWSPWQISRRLRRDHPGVEAMQVSHETIYECLYLQAKGELRTQLKLASGRGSPGRARPHREAERPDHRHGQH